MNELSKERLEYAISTLKRIVEYRKLNQSQLEGLSHVNQSTISKIFSRTSDPSYEMLKKLYEAIGVQLADVLYETRELTHDMYGYLATPLTGVVNDKKSETELLRVIAEIKATAATFSSPAMELYWPGDHTHPLKNAEFSSEQVYLIDRSRASTYDFIILFCAAPSYGVGQENEIATQAGLPAVRLVPKDISRMMSGSFINAIDVTYTGSLPIGVQFDQEELKRAIASIRPLYYQQRAYYKDSNGDSFGNRLQKLINERTGGYQLFADDLGVSISYLHALMEEQFTVSNPSGQLLKRMASRLGTSVGFLLGEAEETDPIWIESNASWRKWVYATPNANAAIALRIRDEWRDAYQLHKATQSTTALHNTRSFRMMTEPVREVDWDLNYQKQATAAGSGNNGKGSVRTRVSEGAADASDRLF